MSIYYNKLDDPRDERLAIEHKTLEELCEKKSIISYESINRPGGLPPENYYVHYKTKSIIGINPDQSPVYGYHHSARISIPVEYPLLGTPDCYMITPIWHPNIRNKGNFSGRICLNFNGFGNWKTLGMIVEEIGEMLQYKRYNAIAGIPPYPEDAKVALWIREYAEPRNIVNKEMGKIASTNEKLISVKKKIRIFDLSKKVTKKVIVVKGENYNEI